MRKILILLVAICYCGCSDNAIEVTTTDGTISIKKHTNRIYSVEIEGHIYLVYANSGGSMVHAEHCPCKKKEL